MGAPEPTWVGWLVGGIILAGGAAGALMTIRKFTGDLARGLRRWDRLFTELAGQPADPENGVERRPSLGERMGRVEECGRETRDELRMVRHRVDAIEHEMHPNAGSSLRDAVDRIARRTDHLQNQPGE